MRRMKTENLINSVQEEIKLFIVESGMKSGDIMPTEKALEEQLGISRTSIREALRSLEALGIIESRHGVGRFVRRFNFDAILDNLSYYIEVNVKDFREIIDVRIALESSFLRKMTSVISDKEIDELFDILNDMDNQVTTGQSDENLIQVHTAFHLKLYEKAENSFLSRLISMFATIQRTLTTLKKYRTSDKGEFIELHRKLIQALVDRDQDLVQQRLDEHFKDVIEWSNENRNAHF